MKNIAPNLLKQQQKFIDSKDKILSLWISYELPKEILLAHNRVAKIS